jgi:Uma2 family endonuclease
MDSQLLRAEELGIRLEIVKGLPIWEASSVIRHQEEIDRIRQSIKKSSNPDGKNCTCFNVTDVYIQFPDDSLKRPDISIFCKKPKERDEAVKEIPKAVIEIISKGYEDKDLKIGVPFYISQGIKDIVVFNPYTMEVLHFKKGRKKKLKSPVEIKFACGCSCEV